MAQIGMRFCTRSTGRMSAPSCTAEGRPRGSRCRPLSRTGLYRDQRRGRSLRHTCGEAAVASRRFSTASPYRLAVLSRNGRLVAVVDVMVMSPRAVIVYRWPPKKDLAVRVTLFVVESV